MATSIFKSNDDNNPQPLLVGIDVAAKMLGMGKTKLRAKVKAGEIPYVPKGTHKMFRPKDLEQYVDSQVIGLEKESDATHQPH